MFELDDAFLDNDDHDEVPEFSPDVIREEMARNHSGIEDRWIGADLEMELPHMNGLFNVQDISVSSLALDSENRSISPAKSSPPQSADDSDLPSGLSRLSLSDERAENYTPDEISNPYPSVIIDASQPIASVEVTPHRPRSPNLQIQPPSPSKEASSSSLHSAPNPTDKTPSSSSPSPPSSAPGPPLNFKRHHNQPRSTGPSAFEKVVSRTRPTFLPPKSRQEDNKHLSDWQTMMRQSRAAGAFDCVISITRIYILFSGEEEKSTARAETAAREEDRRVLAYLGERDCSRLAGRE